MAKIKVTNPQQIINGGAKKYYFKVKGLGGPKGDQGEKGDPGSRGPQGLPGNAATVYVGSTTTLPVGQDATVENVGTQYNAVLNFGIPQGPRGPQGIRGERGEPGQKGDPGPRGIQGEKGTNATVYIGTTSTLNPGTQATVYNSGTDNNAVLNFGIPRGEKGETGATGTTGPAGQNFTPTIVDSLPATGNQSNLYLTPKNYTTGTATGNPITISLGEEAGQISSAQLDGDTTQQTYRGINLLNKPQSYSFTRDLNFQMLPSGTYYVSCGEVTKGGENAPEFGDSSNHISLTSNMLNSVLTVSSSVRLTAYSNGWSWGDSTVTSTVEKLIVTSSPISTLDDYEPYVGGTASPNPDYPQAVNTVTGTQTVTAYGKNLLSLNPNTENGLTGNIQDDSIVTITGKATNTSAKIATATASIPAGTYTFSIDRPSANVTNLIISTNNGTVSFRIAAGQTSATKTLTASGYDYSLWVGAVRDTTYNDTYKLQLELGSTATAFTKYNKQTLPIDLGSIELCKLGTYQDYIYKDGDDWKVHKATDKHIFNGSEDFSLDDIYNNIAQFRWKDSSVIKISDQYVVYTISDNFRGVQYSQSWTANNAITTVNGHNALRFMTSLASTVASFQTWLSTHNTKAYYVLATATDTTITDQTLIAQLEAVRNATLEASNTITNTATGTNLAGDLELRYCEYDPHNRYNKWLWLDINNNYEQLGS